jgi:hypothetical protein
VVGQLPTGSWEVLFDGISSGGRWSIGAIVTSGTFGIYQGTAQIGSATPDGLLHEYTGLFAATASSAFRIDGTTQATGNAGSVAMGGLTVGSNYAGGGNDLSPDYICELLVYSGVLSATDYGKVETYLKSKWGTP